MKDCLSVNEFIMYKAGTLISLLTSLDASHSGNTAYCRSFEHMTVAMKTLQMRPQFMSALCLPYLVLSGPTNRLAHQSRQNVIHDKAVSEVDFESLAPVTP